MIRVPDIIIAIDGYSSTGKSTFAKAIANAMDFLYLDSGALYRAVTLHALENGIIDAEGTIDETALRAALPGLEVHFGRDEDGLCKTYIGGRCVEKEIRSLAVSSHVSPVSAFAFVRNFVDDRLHAFGAAGRVVMDGRDIGTTVFPEAEVKIFLTADEQVRAQRRFDEMVAKGESPKFEDVLENLRQRDWTDAHRDVSPLRRADDAYILDNTEMSIPDELAWVRGLIQGKFGILE